MFVAKVTGSVVATQKTASMVGQKLLLVEPYRLDEQHGADKDGAKNASLKATGRTFVAVDTVGAGTGELVLIVQGSSARLTPETKNLPVDAAIIGIVDSVHLEQLCVYSREN
jgi:microcompartment protein CcmK/EutM